jgi:hypothetical protein
MPNEVLWRDGIPAYDLFSLGMIILESSMPKDWIFRIKTHK